jgi:hypothetical protein
MCRASRFHEAQMAQRINPRYRNPGPPGRQIRGRSLLVWLQLGLCAGRELTVEPCLAVRLRLADGLPSFRPDVRSDAVRVIPSKGAIS